MDTVDLSSYPADASIVCERSRCPNHVIPIALSEALETGYKVVTDKKMTSVKKLVCAQCVSYYHDKRRQARERPDQEELTPMSVEFSELAPVFHADNNLRIASNAAKRGGKLMCSYFLAILLTSILRAIAPRHWSFNPRRAQYGEPERRNGTPRSSHAPARLHPASQRAYECRDGYRVPEDHHRHRRNITTR